MNSSETLAGETAGRVDGPAGYSDPLIGVSTWPQTQVAWRILPPADDQACARLALRVALQADGLIPASSAPGNAATATARESAERFAAVWDQVMQADTHAFLATSLNQPSTGQALPLPVSIDGLRAHVSASYAFTLTASAFEPVFAEPASTPTLAQVIDHYGVDWQALGLACAERELGSLLQLPDSGLSIPVFAPFVAAGNVAALVPEGLDPASVLADAENSGLPLKPGSELVVTASEQAQPAAGLALADLAQALNTTPASLVEANHARAGLLAPGFVFAAQGVEVTVPQTDQPGADASFDDIASLFRDKGVPLDSLMAALASATTPGMFRSAVTLRVNRQLVAAGWSLANNGTGIATATLASLNLTTLDLFAPGTPILLRRNALVGLDNAALGATARSHGLEPGELLRHNAQLAPNAPADGRSGLPIPGLAGLPAAPAGLRIPYRIRAGQSLREIASLFSAASSDPALPAEIALILINQSLPGTLAAGQPLCIDGQTLLTQAGDSFAALIDRANPPLSLEALATAIAGSSEVLAGGALLLCPPAQLSSGNRGISPDTLGERYGQEATRLLGVNVATAGLILPGIALRPAPHATQLGISTVAADSLNAIMRRFARAGMPLTLDELVQTNGDIAFLAPGAQLLLPPADTLLEAAFGGSGWQFPAPCFPLHSWLTISRDSASVNPALRGSATAPSAVEQACSPIPAACDFPSGARAGDALPLTLFAKTLEQLIPGLKLALDREPHRDPAPAELWALSFVEPDGISAVTIGPKIEVPGVEGLQPLSFALRPLSNTLEAENGVAIRSLDPLTGGWGATQISDYQGIDLDVWARAWLADLDRLCSAPYAGPAAVVAAEPLARLQAAKKRLAQGVADGLAPVLVDQANANGLHSSTWTAAREVLYQRLLGQLAEGYDTTAIIQFNVAVTAPAAAAAVRLSGPGRLRTPRLGAAPLAESPARLGTGKTALGPTASGTLSFPLDVPHAARQRALVLEPEYGVDELELDSTPGADAQAAPKRLGFIRAFDSFPPSAFHAALGSPRVPLPIRSYPQMPALLWQRVETADAPQSVDAALHWNYLFAHTYQGAAQDLAHDPFLLEVEFNRRASPPSALVAEDNLIRALAQYRASSDSLWQLLAELHGDNATPSNSRLARALDTYAGLAERVAGLWSAWWGVGSSEPDRTSFGQARPVHRDPVHRTLVEPLRSGQPPMSSRGALPERYCYRASLDSAQVDAVEVYRTLTLERLLADGALDWPDIWVIGDDDTQLALAADAASGTTRVYRFPTEDAAQRVPVFSPLRLQYSCKDLHIARYQSANAALSVLRNTQLLGPAGPETCMAFVYRTPPQRFAEPLVPLLSFDTRLAIGAWTWSAASNPLNGLFGQVFDNDPDGQQIAVNLGYGYSLGPIETLLPVLLSPGITYDSASTVQQLIDAATAWTEQSAPQNPGGFWSLDLSWYAASPSSPLPLLQLRNLVLSIE